MRLVERVATACLFGLGFVSSALGGLPVSGWPLHPRPWTARRAWPVAAISVLLLLYGTVTLAVRMSDKQTPFLVMGIAVTFFLRVLVAVWDVVARFSFCSMLRYLWLYCDRHPLSASAWRLVLACLTAMAFLRLTSVTCFLLNDKTSDDRVFTAYTLLSMFHLSMYSVQCALPMLLLADCSATLRRDCEHLIAASAARVRPLRRLAGGRVPRTVPAPPQAPRGHGHCPPLELEITGSPPAIFRGPNPIGPILEAESAPRVGPGRLYSSPLPRPPGELGVLQPLLLRAAPWRALRVRHQLVHDLYVGSHGVAQGQLLLLVVTTFFYAVVQLSGGVCCLMRNVFCMGKFFDAASYLLMIWLLCHVFQMVDDEDVKIAHVIYTYTLSAIDTLSDAEKHEVGMFLQQTRLRTTTTCSVLGLFTFDKGTVMQVVSGVVSYLFVALQMSHDC